MRNIKINLPKIVIIVTFILFLFMNIVYAKENLIDKKLINEYGINGDIIQWYSNDRDYEWYIDQSNTGNYSNINCSPTCATMALKWQNKDFDKTVQDARKTIKPNGGCWSNFDLYQYLDENDCKYESVEFPSLSEMTDELKNNNIYILIIDSTRLTQGNNRIGLYYTPSTGHSIIVKGFVETEEKTYLEVYDPYSNNLKYSDDTPKGKNRYFDYNEIKKALKNEWEKAVEIYGEGVKNK